PPSHIRRCAAQHEALNPREGPAMMTTNGKHTFLDMDVGKAFAGFAFPGFDVDTLVAAQRKNLEALTQANQLAVEGVQAIARRQVEIARQAVDEASAAFREFTQPGAP